MLPALYKPTRPYHSSGPIGPPQTLTTGTRDTDHQSTDYRPLTEHYTSWRKHRRLEETAARSRCLYDNCSTV